MKFNLLVFLIFIYAFILRSVFIDNIPFIISGDEARVGVEAQNINHFKFIDAGYWGIPNAYFFVVSYTMRLFGDNLTGLRWSSFLGGVLGFISFYLLLKEIIIDRKIFLIGLIVFASSGYQIHYSRIGVGQGWDVFFICLTLYFLLKYVRDRKKMNIVFTGLGAGISQYFWYGGRVIPIILIVGLLGLRLYGKCRSSLKILMLVCLFLFSFLAIYSPQFYHETFIKHEGAFARLKDVGILQSGWLKRELATKSIQKIFFDQVMNSISLYFTGPDNGWFYLSNTQRAVMGTIIIPFIILGFLFTLYKIKNYQNFIILCWLGIAFLLNGILATAPPHSERLIITFPAVVILTVYSFLFIKSLISFRNIGIIIVVLVVMFYSFDEINHYFSYYNKNQILKEDLMGQYFSYTPRLLSSYSISEYKIYFLKESEVGYYARPTFLFILKKEGTDIKNIDGIERNNQLFVVLGGINNKAAFYNLKKIFPKGLIDTVRNRQNQNIGMIFFSQIPKMEL